MTGWRKRTIMEMAQETLYRMNTVDDSAEYWTATDNELEAFAKLVREDALAQPAPVAIIDGDTSDGYHTFNELYEFRKAYNAALFNEWAAGNKCSVHKSWRHHDGEPCFGGGWFIVVAVLPDGQISNHYEAKDWDLFAVPETERALFEFDGHTGADVVERLKAYTTSPAQPAPVQEPVAFKIYKPTPPRGAIPNVRDAELPWVYDQDPSSGNVASMWVTPVQTLRSKS